MSKMFVLLRAMDAKIQMPSKGSEPRPPPPPPSAPSSPFVPAIALLVAAAAGSPRARGVRHLRGARLLLLTEVGEHVHGLRISAQILIKLT